MRYLFIFITLFAGARTAFGQPVQNPLPLKQTQNAVTLSVTKAGFFDNQSAFGGGMSWAREGGGRPWFYVRYEVQNAQAQKTPDSEALGEADARSGTAIARLFAPSGELLTPFSGGDLRGSQHLKWVNVEPRWDHVTLEVLTLDPAAPLKAAGRFLQGLTFSEVPCPRTLNKEVPVGAILRTKQGTTITLDSVTVTTNNFGDEKFRLNFNFQWEPPRLAPNLRLEADLNSVRDTQNKELPSDSGGGDFGEHQFTLSRDLHVMPTAASLTVGIKLHERADALRELQHWRRFRCELKLPQAANFASASAPPSRTVESKNVIASLEKVRWLGGPDGLQTWLWTRLREPAVATGARREWFVTVVTARDQNNRKLETSCEGDLQSDWCQIAWRSDGVPAAPGERSVLVRAQWDKPRPSKVTLEAKAEERWHRHRVATFADVPLPAPGKSLEINAEVIDALPGDAPGSRIILRRIARIEDPKRPMFFPGGPRQNLRAGSLALLFEVVPALAQGKTELRGKFAEDDTGILLHDGDSIAIEEGDIVGFGQTKGWLRTMLLDSPPPGAKSLRVQVVVDETKATGEQATLLFPDVPVPDAKYE